MGITDRREREREEIRAKILESARELFASEGYDKVTMRRIAEAIEYSPTTIYHHFEDKEDLVHCLCETDFARLLGVLQQGEPAADPVERVRRLGRAYADFALAYPNHYRFMFMTPFKEHGHEGRQDFAGHRAFDLLRSAVQAAVEAGRFRRGDPDLIAQVLWSSLHGVVALLITVRPEHWPTPPAPDLVDRVIDQGLRGFLER
jgi:AcrR family transcriptional regulator